MRWMRLLTAHSATRAQKPDTAVLKKTLSQNLLNREAMNASANRMNNPKVIR